MALGHIPVRNCDVGHLEVRIRPPRRETLVQLVDCTRVSVNGLLLQITHEAVANIGVDEVGEEKEVLRRCKSSASAFEARRASPPPRRWGFCVTYKVHALRAQNHNLHKPSRLTHLQEGEEVHALVVRLLEQRLDPAVVPLQRPQRAQVPQHSGHHAGHASDRLEEDEPDELCSRPSAYYHRGGDGTRRTYPLPLRQRLIGDHRRRGPRPVRLLLAAQPRRLIHEKPRRADQGPRDLVAPRHRFPVARDDGQHLGLGVAMVGPRRRGGADVGRLFGGEEVAEAGRLCRGEGPVGRAGRRGVYRCEPQARGGEERRHGPGELGGLSRRAELGVYLWSEHWMSMLGWM